MLCTQGLTYLLQTHEDARSALADELKTRTGIRIGESVTWIAEALQDDLTRPDLEARTIAEVPVPVVKIEAKLGAELHAKQLQSYEADLRKRNSGETAMLVLVPKGRTIEAGKVIAKAFDKKGSGPWRVTDGHPCGIAVISWDELFTALRGGEDERFLLELEQLQAMYRELRSDFIAPLASDEDLRQWESCETDFVELVKQVTRRLTKQHRLYPMLKEPLEQVSPERKSGKYQLRSVCPLVDDAKSCYSIGVRDSFAETVTPIWMRFHQATGNFRLIRQRIELSGLEQVESGGHIWIPLEVLRDVSGEQMIEDLVRKAEKVLRVAYQTE